MQGVIKHMIITKERHTIIFFDIRNFSEHRSRLADKGRASLLTEFVKDVLNGAVDLLNARKEQFEMDPKPILNHTGDGFMLIVRGRKNPLLGLLWLSEFRRFVSSRIKSYERSICGLFTGTPPKKLDFGIGGHYGLALPFEFKDFEGVDKRVGFIGSALNIASRVEQCTKDHVQKIITTDKLLDAVRQSVTLSGRKRINSFIVSLGRHRIRGFDKPIKLFGFTSGFHQAWKED
jgi:class 3 adenylate cyclase